MQKKILLISQCFYPEIGAQSNRITAIAALLSQMGYPTDVLTAEPSSPNKKMYANPKFWEYHKGIVEEFKDFENVTIIRTKGISRGSKSGALRRIAYYIVFFVKAVSYAFTHRGYGAVIATTPQILTGLAGVIAGKLNKCPLIWDFRDIWPESIAGVNMIKRKNPIMGVLSRIERSLFANSRAIIYNSKGFLPYLQKKNASAKLVYIPNCLWEDEFDLHEYPEDGELRVVYLGNVGLAQDLKKLIETARETAWNDKITYTVYGDGAFFLEFQRLVAQNGLKNIKCMGMIPKHEIKKELRQYDLAYAHIKASPVFHTVLPSKLVMYMGCSMPILAGVAGNAAEMLDEANCAFVVEPEDHHQMAGILSGLQMSGDKSDMLRKMGTRGRRYARYHFSWSAYREDLCEVIEGALNHG